MDCLQCVRSKQWVGAVPLGLVMGGDLPTRPDDEEDESLTARLTWPHPIQAKRQAIAGIMMMWVQNSLHFSFNIAVFPLFLGLTAGSQ